VKERERQESVRERETGKCEGYMGRKKSTRKQDWANYEGESAEAERRAKTGVRRAEA
jgi:hypothetical protein